MKEPLLDSILQDVEDPAERERLRGTWDRLGALETAEPSPELARRFAQAIEFTHGVGPDRPSWTRRMMPAAAALAVGIAIGSLVMRLSDVPRDEVAQAAAVKAIATVLESRPLAPRRLDAVETLVGFPGNADTGRLLTEIASSDPSIGVRLVAIDALEPHVADDEIARQLIRTARSTDSTLVRIRLIELFVDHRIGTALPQIEALQRDPYMDELVRESARWAIDRL